MMASYGKVVLQGKKTAKAPGLGLAGWEVQLGNRNPKVGCVRGP